MKKIKLTLLCVLLCILHAYTQVSDSLFTAFCANEDLVILSEDRSVTFTGEKSEYILVEVRNTSTVVINNEKGMQEYQPLVLPKRIDELYIFHAPEVRNINWDYDDIQVIKMEAVRLEKGTRKPLKTEAKTINNRVIDRKGFFGLTELFHYSINDLTAGDTIEVSYHFRILFRENWIRLLSNRIFLHGKYPKKHATLRWCYNKHLVVDSLFVNMDEPQVNIEGNQLCYSWEAYNLPGALDEPGSRPYKELPHMIFVPKPYEFEYTHYDSYKMEFIPIYYFLANRRQDEIRVEMWDNVIGNKNKNNLYYEKVANKIIHLAPDDTTGIERMRYFQQFMVDSVRYDKALKFYMAEEQNLRQRPGVTLWGYTVDDNNLERIYGNMIPRLAKDLFTAYPIDKRAGEISQIYCPTVHANDLMFLTIFKNGTGGYVIPRSDKNHYYLDELPFYYEDIPVMLIHIYDYANPRLNFPDDYDFTYAYYPFDLGSGRRNYNADYRETKTPISNPKDNYRKVQSMVNVDLDTRTASFQTRVFVSGQYSTLTRCVYCSKPIDSTINPKYLEPVWNVSENVMVENLKPDQPDILYPFKTTIHLDYAAADLIQVKDTILELDIGKWFKPVYNEDLQGPRYLNYHPDFQGFDQYAYMLEFDRPVRLIADPAEIEIRNKYASLIFSVKQTAENKILVNCHYEISARKVDVEDFQHVKEINGAIASLFKKKVVFQIAGE